MPLTKATPSIKIPFHGSPNPTVGVELELQILDPNTFNLKSGSVDLLGVLGDHPKIKQELTQSTIEVITGICNTAAEARDDLAASIRELYDLASGYELTFASAGTHPFAQWREQDIFPNERYQHLVDKIQWPARRLLIYGLHVHVGISSGEKAITILNSLTTYLPHLLALSSSSPFIDHEITGLASARTKLFEGMPTAGLPFRLNSYGEFQRFMNTLVRAKAIETIREIWWDIRPHPGFGTLELRICDAPSTLREVAALTALTQCLAVWMSDNYEEGIQLKMLHSWIVRENKWRACRHGLDAKIIVSNDGDQVALREHIPRLVEDLMPYAVRLKCDTELADILKIVEAGASYERQLRLYDSSGRFEDVMEHLTDELKQDVVQAA
ncbi:MAG: glutamate--cysteine ligase [Rubricoccaceae bacterium]|nr:glutamate--cysteine ligase [Rubricoccaceae bacterium]